MAYIVRVTTLHVMTELPDAPVHIDANDMLAASTPDEYGSRRVDVVLRGGDTAYAPGTTKKVFMGPGTVTYLIHPSGWQAYPIPDALDVVPALVYKS